MRLFSIRIFLFLSSFVFFYTLPWIISLNNELNKSNKIRSIYSSGNLDSLRRINNKIIFIGGSNLLFGLDKYQLQKNLNRPVVSLAHVRTDGICNMLELVKKVYYPGDLVILSLEYGGATKDASGELLDYYLSNNKLDLIDYFLKNYIWKKESFNPHYSIEEENKRREIYSSFNKDFFLKGLRNQNYRKMEEYNNQGYQLKYDEKDKNKIAEFIFKMRIPIYAAHPILVKQKMSSQNEIELDKKSKCLPLRYITIQSDYVFDTTYIFDYSSHLNSNGRYLRTKLLSRDISRFISSKTNQTHQGSN
jgi:hypothetical protein